MKLAALDLLDLETPVRPSRFGAWHWAIMVVAALAFGLCFATGLRALGVFSPAMPTGPAIRLSLQTLPNLVSLNVDDKDQIYAQGVEAEARNAMIPLAKGVGGNVAAFQIPASMPGETTALRCLTQAIYYEAAREPLEGQRAVAQVVLNRVRHPSYPKSVCGVVYEGSERRTGCQFSFTCDGSLLRAPMASYWHESEAVARQALAGYVERSVGTATHYHADYVLPKWAFQLAKIEQIGRHIFYRFGGTWGQSAMLSGRYSGNERIPALNLVQLRERLVEADAALPEEQLVPGLTVTPIASDRHAEADVGGRIDTTRTWRLTIPDPVEASSRYRKALGTDAAATAETVSPQIAEK